MINITGTFEMSKLIQNFFLNLVVNRCLEFRLPALLNPLVIKCTRVIRESRPHFNDFISFSDESFWQ